MEVDAIKRNDASDTNRSDSRNDSGRNNHGRKNHGRRNHAVIEIIISDDVVINNHEIEEVITTGCIC